MSIRTLEEEKEYDELKRRITFSEDEKQQVQKRIEELEKKEENKEYEEYRFQQDLIEYDIDNLTLRQLQEKYMEDYDLWQDEYENLEYELEEQKGYYESYISDSEDEIDYLKEEITTFETSEKSHIQQIENYKDNHTFPIFAFIIIILFTFFVITICKK